MVVFLVLLPYAGSTKRTAFWTPSIAQAPRRGDGSPKATGINPAQSVRNVPRSRHKAALPHKRGMAFIAPVYDEEPKYRPVDVVRHVYIVNL